MAGSSHNIHIGSVLSTIIYINWRVWSWVHCLMMLGIRKDIRYCIWHSVHLQITVSETRPYIKWVIRMAMADSHINLHQRELNEYMWVSILTLSPSEELLPSCRFERLLTSQIIKDHLLVLTKFIWRGNFKCKFTI